MSLTNNLIFLFLYLFFSLSANAEGYVKAGESLIWDSENKSYTANGDVEFKNDRFIAYADKMIAMYEEKDNEEIFTVIELFNNVVIEFE